MAVGKGIGKSAESVCVCDDEGVLQSHGGWCLLAGGGLHLSLSFFLIPQISVRQRLGFCCWRLSLLLLRAASVDTRHFDIVGWMACMGPLRPPPPGLALLVVQIGNRLRSKVGSFAKKKTERRRLLLAG